MMTAKCSYNDQAGVYDGTDNNIVTANIYCIIMDQFILDNIALIIIRVIIVCIILSRAISIALPLIYCIALCRRLCSVQFLSWLFCSCVAVPSLLHHFIHVVFSFYTRILH